MDQQLLGLMLKMTLSLAFVIACFWGAIVVFKKISTHPKFLKKSDKTKPMEVLAYQGLGPNKGLYLIRCLDQKLLVGCTTQNVNLISTIVEEDADYSEAFQSNLKEKLPETTTQKIKDSVSSKLQEISRV